LQNVRVWTGDGFQGYPKKEVHGLEADAKIPRAYYVCPTCGVEIFPLHRRLRLRRDGWTEGLVEIAARLGITQPSFAIAAETLSELMRVTISATTVWRHHWEVTHQLEVELEQEEQTVPPLAYVAGPRSDGVDSSTGSD
jgi:hypothetical protein